MAGHAAPGLDPADPPDRPWIGPPIVICLDGLAAHHQRRAQLATLVDTETEWESSLSDAAILRGDFRVVRFHRREAEMDALEAWGTAEEPPLALRLYTAPGGYPPLDHDDFKRVLLVHAIALAAVEGERVPREEILDWLLERGIKRVREDRGLDPMFQRPMVARLRRREPGAVDVGPPPGVGRPKIPDPLTWHLAPGPGGVPRPGTLTQRDEKRETQTMTKTAAQILDDARSLSEADRAELAFQLLDTLDPPRSPRTDEEWLREIERRAERALAGEPGVSWEEARKELEESLRAL